MKKTFTLILALVASMFICNQAFADGYHTVTLQSEKADWQSTSQEFSLSSIAEELNTTGEGLHTAILEWVGAGYATDFYTLLDQAGEWSSSRGSAGDGAFYIDTNGVMQDGWGSAVAYARLDYDEENLYITIGQTPSAANGDQIKCMVSLLYNEQRVTFNVTMYIKAPDGPDVEQVTKIADLDVVEHITFEATQEPNNDWASTDYSVPTEGIASKLGIDNETLVKYFKATLYAKKYDGLTENWSEDLTNEFTATPSPGFWFSGGVFLNESEEESMELTQSPYAGSNKFWVAGIDFDPEADAVNVGIGQYPDAWKLGECRTADLYIVYGKKAYIITFKITVDVADLDPITNYTKVGGEQVIIDRDPRNGWDVLDEHIFSMDNVIKAFAEAGMEVTKDDLVLSGIDKYESVTTNYTADAPGFWLSSEGKVQYYSDGGKAYFVDYFTGEEGDTLAVGNMPGQFDGGEILGGSLYLISGDKYYEFEMTVNIAKPSYTLETCEIIEKDITVQVIPSSSAWQMDQTTDMTAIEEILGTSSAVLYGVTDAGAITNAYSVSEATTYGGGGFWMSPEDEAHNAYAAGYSGTGAFAMWYYESEIKWFNVPGFRNAGEETYSTFYFANLWDGKAVKMNLTLKFVDKVTEIKAAGEEDVPVAARDEENKDYAEVAINMEACCKALGCTEEQFAENGKWAVMTAEGEMFSDDFDEIYGYSLDANGFAADFAEASVMVGYFDGTIRSWVINDADIDNQYKVNLYAQYGTKTYVFHIIVNAPTAISSINAANAKTGKIYDLSGRCIINPAKGIYIQDGKKYIR